MTNTAPTSSIGKGEIESFILSDPTPLLTASHPKPAIKKLWPGRRFVGVVTAPEPTEIEIRTERLRRLNLHQLVIAEEFAIRLDTAHNLYPELVGEEHTLWSKFLPTQYEMRDYQYDSIPDAAIGEIQIATQLGCFDRIIIWTPEGNDLNGRLKRRWNQVREVGGEVYDRVSDVMSDISWRLGDFFDKLSWSERRSTNPAGMILARTRDPLAIGVINDHNGVDRLFPIVRWGESLLPINEVRAHVKSVDRQMQFGVIAVLASIGALVAKLVIRR